VVWIPSGTDLFNFKMAFKLLGYKDALKNTLILVMPCVIIQVITCLFVSYGFARFEFRFKGLLFGLLVFSLIVPVQSYIIPLYVNMKTMHLLDTYWQFYIMALLGTGIRSGLYIYIFHQFFEGMDKALEESAQIDGCGNLRYFFQVVLPLSKAIIAVIALWAAVGHWNSYFNALIYLRTNEKYPLQLVMRNILINNEVVANQMTGSAAAEMNRKVNLIKYGAIVVSSLPIMCMYPFVQKYFNQGVMIGAVKG
jgi:putative aldouronate transport system permease protein